MDLEMVLNELSLKTPVGDRYEARQLMSQLIGTLRQATANGANRVLRTSDEIHSLELAPNYRISQWRNDPKVDREESRFFKTLVTKAPFWTDVFEEFKDEFDLSDIKHQGELVRGIGFALIIDALPISFNSEKRWNCCYLSLEIIRIDANQEVVDETVKIVHASCHNHVLVHADWIKNRIRTEVTNGEQLWSRRQELFPSLEFCDDVSKQIQSLDTGKPMLTQVLKRLLELEEYCKTWKNGAFDSDALPSKVTPESESRLNQFKDKLTFECSDGKKRVFSLHARMTPGAWRLHFCTELGPGKIIIGYIGPKIQ
ncbi:hypothetical protein [Mastigocoleus testarum]|uniref:Uncharacterized protein n=1 Tax=Mastigocoleus testarum BC008 TaxID=371196 RepID=A0A0V7ZR66_9CYAN|nr:hypothetical protein [Mastigocoleus testarum]KST66984.1 hypothetical protein BC008_27740 [Mastigocoleus testarum BC008]KST67127.1 hypothetical protein BC008_28440 [Mastigocoleus testarum BC008]